MASSRSRPSDAAAGSRPPVLQVTRYDFVTALLIALIASLVLTVAWLVTVWWVNRPQSAPRDVPMELIEIPGGDEEGVVGETLRLETPAPLREDPALADVPEEETQIEETLETVVELADEATQQTEQQYETDSRHAGRAGSAAGTGRRALGRGPGESGIPREQRWFVGFSDTASLETYAKQLAHFDIELGALYPDGRLVYLSNVAADVPTTREVRSGSDERRLYFTWNGGGRRVADMQLFQKAGVDAGGATIFHFYPAATEAELARLEREYRGIPADEIRRTYFAVRHATAGEGYEFVVTRQVFLR